MVNFILNGLLILFIFISLATQDVKAYLDPGSGSYLLQILFASFFSALLVVKTFWRKILNFVKQIIGSRIGQQKNLENEEAN